MTIELEAQTMRRLKAANPCPASAIPEEPPNPALVLNRVRAIEGTRPARRRLVTRVGAVATVAALVAIALLVSRGGGSEAQAAADVLRQAARNVRSGAPALRAGDFYYTRVLVSFPSAAPPDCLVQRKGMQQTWIAADGSGWVRGSISPARFASEAERKTCLAGGVPNEFAGRRFDGSLEGGTEAILGPPSISYQAFRALPVDVSRLARVVARLAQSSGGATAVSTLGVVSDLLESWPASARLRAALLRVAAETPGLHLVGRTTDPAGRPGVAVEARLRAGAADVVIQLIVDPHSGQLLARRLIMGAGGSSRVESTTWLRSVVTQSAPRR